MLPGFPKSITTTKLDRGHYRISREDGCSIEVRRSSNGDWYQVGNMVRAKSLGIFKFDMRHGYMTRDYLKAQE